MQPSVYFVEYPRRVLSHERTKMLLYCERSNALLLRKKQRTCELVVSPQTNEHTKFTHSAKSGSQTKVCGYNANSTAFLFYKRNKNLPTKLNYHKQQPPTKS